MTSTNIFLFQNSRRSEAPQVCSSSSYRLLLIILIYPCVFFLPSFFCFRSECNLIGLMMHSVFSLVWIALIRGRSIIFYVEIDASDAMDAKKKSSTIFLYTPSIKVSLYSPAELLYYKKRWPSHKLIQSHYYEI